MRKVFAKGINFAAQINPSRKIIPDYQQISELSNIPIKSLNCGYLQSYFLLQNGQVLKIGNLMDVLVNIRQLNLYRLFPSVIGIFQKIPFLGKTLSFRAGHSNLTTINMELYEQGIKIQNAEFGLSRMFLTDQNQNIYVIGQNYFGQLGTNDNLTLENTFRRIQNPPKQKIKSLSVGFQHTCFVTESGNLYGCGKADSYQIQPLDMNSRKSNQKVTDKIVDLTPIWKGNVKFVGCGFKHTIFSTQDNELYSLGNNKYGQCGHNYKIEKQITRPKRIYFKLLKDQQIVDIKCGFKHSLILTTKNLYFFGCTQQYQNPFDQYNQNLSSPSILKLPFKPIKIFTNFDRISVIGDGGQCIVFGGNSLEKIGGQSGQVQNLSQIFNTKFDQNSLVGLGFGHTIVCP